MAKKNRASAAQSSQTAPQQAADVQQKDVESGKAEEAKKQQKSYFDILDDLSVSYTEEVSAKIRRLNDLIGTAHSLSVGLYKEHVIREQIEQVTPKKYSVNTGFVFSQRGGKPILSRQIDILIWDSSNYPPLVQAGDFVIIHPESLRAAIEVKGMMDHGELDDSIDNLESLTTFSNEVMLRKLVHQVEPIPFFRFLVATGIATKTKDDPETEELVFPKSFWNKIHAKYSDEAVKSRLQWCKQAGVGVSPMAWINGIAVLGKGYLSARVLSDGEPRMVSYVLASEAREDASVKDDSIGILRTHLGTALRDPSYFARIVSHGIHPPDTQMILPRTPETLKLVPGAKKPAKPTEKKREAGGDSAPKGS